MSAMNLTEPVEHRKAMQTVTGLQRLSIEETKKVNRLENFLLNRQIKMMEKEKAEYEIEG